MNEDKAVASAPQRLGISCPKCRQPAGELRRPETGMLEFKCEACGHLWVLFDQSPHEGSDR